MPGKRYDQLYELAADQFGYVTAAQARAAGISPQTLVMMERRNALRRTSHGVYRLINFPESEHDAFMEAVLWPVGVSAVISHDTALLLHELGDVNPTVIHLTVPRGYRTTRIVPRHIRIHFQDLMDEERMVHDGLPITTPERTIRDCISTHLGPALIDQAVDSAVLRGLISEAAARQFKSDR